MKSSIVSVIRYFNYFLYPPSIKEIHMYMSSQIAMADLLIWLKRLERSKEIIRKGDKYALGGYGKIFADSIDRKGISAIKIQKVSWFIKMLSIFPQIQLIGITGGVSMFNSNIDDDIDIFIISARGRLWTARMIILIMSSIFGIRRSYSTINVKNKLCFNLFFDSLMLGIMGNKRNRYIAHEIVQMKPLHVKNNIYTQFLDSNNWINDFFPNLQIDDFVKKNSWLLVSQPVKSKISRTFVGNWFELLFKSIQMVQISKHHTNETITENQLWFFPHDFQNKIKKLI